MLMNMLQSSEMQNIASQLASSMSSETPNVSFQTSFSSNGSNIFPTAATGANAAAAGGRASASTTATGDGVRVDLSDYDGVDMTEAERQEWESIIVEDETFQETMPEQPDPSEAYVAGNQSAN